MSDGLEMSPYVAIALTSIIASIMAVTYLGLRPSDLGRALGRMAELVGAGVIFALVNIAAGAALSLIFRALTGRFVSLYALDDLTWLVVSLMQGCLWWLCRNTTTPASR
jgi:hypothetical protein